MPSFSSKSQLTPAVSSSGLVPFADIDLIRGAFKVYPSIGSLRGQPTALFTDSQIVFVKDTSKLYQCDYDTADNIFVFADSMSFSEFTFSGGSSTDISSLNTFTGSIQTEVTTLTAATSSYLTSVPSGTISGSTQIGALGYITSVPSGTLSGSAQVETIIDDTYISASAALSGFGAGGGSSTDISALNTFTGSIQTEVTTLTAATSSYLIAESTASLLRVDQTSSMTVATASYALYAISASHEIITELSSSHAVQADSASFISDTFISASAVRSGFGAGGSSTDISALNTFTGSIQTEVTTLTDATSSYLTSVSLTEASFQTILDNGTQLDASGKQKIMLSGSILLNQSPTGYNDNELRAGSVSAINGGGFHAVLATGSANRDAISYGIAGNDDNFVETKFYSGLGYNTVDARTIFTTLYPHDYVTANLQGKYIESTGKGLTGDDAKRGYFEVDINTSQAKYLSPLTASNGFVADEIKISSIWNNNTNTNKFLVIDSAGLIEYRSGSQLLDSIGAMSSFDSNIVSSSTQISGLGFLSSLPSGTVSGSTQITSVITDTYISASAAASGFGSGGGVSTDISSLNTFSGSIQTEVTSLTQATASYLDNTNTILVEQSTPTAEAGGIYYSGSDFFVGID